MYKVMIKLESAVSETWVLDRSFATYDAAFAYVARQGFTTNDGWYIDGPNC